MADIKRDVPHVLCVNPWIHDFAAYDFWAKPLGLLTLAAILRRHGIDVSYIDCLDRFHPCAAPFGAGRQDGRGPYHKEKVARPKGLEDVTRTFSRYGIAPEWFEADLRRLAPPDLILVTSMMTYWASGVQETISRIKTVFPLTPVVLGGIYASLCTEHARSHSGADQVATGPGEVCLPEIIRRHCGFEMTPEFDPVDMDSYPYPAFDLQHRIDYIPLLTSKGCPFSCPYCASGFLNPRRMVRQPRQVMAEINHWHQSHGVRNFVFYDDALLIDPENHIIPLLERIIEADLRLSFHTPNALHVREITPRIARLMFSAGFKTIRLGLETAVFEHRDAFDRKVGEKDFFRSVQALKAAGFRADQIGAYLLVGLPGQSPGEVERSVSVVKNSGIMPVLAYYSPIPHTALWPQAVASSRYALAAAPLFTNNAIFPCRHEAFSWNTVSHLKKMTANLHKNVDCVDKKGLRA